MRFGAVAELGVEWGQLLDLQQRLDVLGQGEQPLLPLEHSIHEMKNNATG